MKQLIRKENRIVHVIFPHNLCRCKRVANEVLKQINCWRNPLPTQMQQASVRHKSLPPQVDGVAVTQMLVWHTTVPLTGRRGNLGRADTSDICTAVESLSQVTRLWRAFLSATETFQCSLEKHKCSLSCTQKCILWMVLSCSLSGTVSKGSHKGALGNQGS
jgi:hypothetical protein